MLLLRNYWTWVFLLLIFLWARWASLFLPLDRDEGAYAYIGWIWFSGYGIPYLSVFDHKPPLVYLPYGIANIIFGNTFLGIRIVSLVWALVTTFVFYKLSKKIANATLSLLATVIFVLFSSSVWIEGLSFNVESILLLPILLYCLLIGSLVEKKENKYWKWYTGGILAAILLWIKPVTIYLLILIGVWTLFRIKKIKPFFVKAAGVITITLLILTYFYLVGGLQHLIKDVFIYNSLYVKESFPKNNICYQILDGIPCYIFWLFRLTPFLSIAIPAVLFTILYKYKKANIWKEIIIIATFGAWLATKGGGGNDYVHYYLLLVPGVTLCILFCLKMLFKKRLFLLFYIYAISLFAWYLIWDKPYELPEKRLRFVLDVTDQRIGGVKDAPETAQWLKGKIDKKDSLVVWANEPQLYFYLAKPAVTRNINFFELRYSKSEEEFLLKNLLYKHSDWLITYNNNDSKYLTHDFNHVWTNNTYKIFMKTNTR